jgi:hypothetical protein
MRSYGTPEPSASRPLHPEAPFRETRAMTDQSDRVAALLHEAGETHHRVYRIVDGDDPDWASWYAQWLLDLSELPQILGVTPVRSELVWLLVSLDKDFTETNPDVPWPQWYASRIIEHFAAAGQ